MEIGGISFSVGMIVIAIIAFFVLKKVVKMAIRAVIVAVILLIAIVGGISLWMSSEKTPAARPAANSTKPVAR